MATGNDEDARLCISHATNKIQEQSVLKVGNLSFVQKPNIETLLVGIHENSPPTNCLKIGPVSDEPSTPTPLPRELGCLLRPGRLCSTLR